MEYTVFSGTGDREINEDFAVAETINHLHCLVVCDGLGGHGKGEVASQLVAQHLVQYFKEHPIPDNAHITEAFETAQSKLLEEQEKAHMKNGMKTTAVMLLADEKSAVWAHIGDSRLYLFQKGKLVSRTLDHSVPQMLVMAGDIKEKQIRNHPDRNCLLRAFGTAWTTNRYEISPAYKLNQYHSFLLCTDGFWEYITEKMMCKLLKKSHSSEEWMQYMLNEVRKNGGNAEMDNYTAITAMVSG